jgi:hypothetical protein
MPRRPRARGRRRRAGRGRRPRRPDARARAPIEQGFAALHLEGGRNFLARFDLDGKEGKAIFEGVPPGSYVLEVDADDHVPSVEELRLDGLSLARLDGASVGRTVLLERASWIVVRIAGMERPEDALHLAAVALAGGDPGWAFRTLDGGRPMAISRVEPESRPPVFRFKARPGRYHLRLILAGTYTFSTARLSREVEVEVPAGGEATVDL